MLARLAAAMAQTTNRPETRAPNPFRHISHIVSFIQQTPRHYFGTAVPHGNRGTAGCVARQSISKSALAQRLSFLQVVHEI